MKSLSNEELVNTTGGSWKTFAFIAAGIVVFTFGVIDGYLRPKKCR